MTIYTDTLETGENVYMIASERSERAEFVLNICVEKHTILLNIYIVDKSMFVGRIIISLCFVTLVIWSCLLYRLENKKLVKTPQMISSERSERAEIFVHWRRKHILHNYTDQKLKKKL